MDSLDAELRDLILPPKGKNKDNKNKSREENLPTSVRMI